MMQDVALPSRRRAYGAFAGSALFIYLMLGIAVRNDPHLAFDDAFSAWAGHQLRLAWIFSSSGLFTSLILVQLVVLTGGLLQRAWLSRSIFAIVIDLIGWVVSDTFKAFFHRARPEHWYIHQETSYSYSSGHALHAILIYGLWAVFFWRSSLPSIFRFSASCILIVWVGGILWSRLALHVHFATDLIGGIALACSLLGYGFALFPKVLQKPQ